MARRPAPDPVVVPNANLLFQWAELIDEFYSMPYVVISSRSDQDALITQDEPNPFLQNAVVITTYEFASGNENAAKAIPWKLTVFEEANALVTVYQDGNQQAMALKRIAESSFKLLLLHRLSGESSNVWNILPALRPSSFSGSRWSV